MPRINMHFPFDHTSIQYAYLPADVVDVSTTVVLVQSMC